MKWLLMWLNVSVATLNATLQLLVIYRCGCCSGERLEGRLVFACSQKVNTTFPLQAEVEVVKWALLLATKLEAKGIYIETDSKICCDALINPSQTSPRRIRSKVMEMQILLSTSSYVFVSWVPRLANMAAHSLAKWSLSCNFFGSFDIGYCPPCFASIVWGEAGS